MNQGMYGGVKSGKARRTHRMKSGRQHRGFQRLKMPPIAAGTPPPAEADYGGQGFGYRAQTDPEVGGPGSAFQGEAVRQDEGNPVTGRAAIFPARAGTLLEHRSSHGYLLSGRVLHHRRRHGNFPAGCVLSADIAKELPEPQTPRLFKAACNGDLGGQMHWMLADLEARVLPHGLVGLLFGHATPVLRQWFPRGPPCAGGISGTSAQRAARSVTTTPRTRT